MNKSILAVAVTIASLTLAGCGTEANQAAQQQQTHAQPLRQAGLLSEKITGQRRSSSKRAVPGYR